MFGMGTNRLRHACVTSFTGLPTVHGTPKDMHLHIPAKYINWCNRTAPKTTMLYPETDHVPSQAEHRIKHDHPSRLISKDKASNLPSFEVCCLHVIHVGDMRTSHGIEIFEC